MISKPSRLSWSCCVGNCLFGIIWSRPEIILRVGSLRLRVCGDSTILSIKTMQSQHEEGILTMGEERKQDTITHHVVEKVKVYQQILMDICHVYWANLSNLYYMMNSTWVNRVMKYVWTGFMGLYCVCDLSYCLPIYFLSLAFLSKINVRYFKKHP